jgi:hypothetical protein
MATPSINNVQQLPFESGAAFQQFATVINGTTYAISLRWNARDAAWYFDLADADESPIVSGIKVVQGALLGRRCTDARFPRGVIWAVDLSNQKLDATFDDLGTRVAVYFYPLAEWLAGV